MELDNQLLAIKVILIDTRMMYNNLYSKYFCGPFHKCSVGNRRREFFFPFNISTEKAQSLNVDENEASHPHGFAAI